MTKYNVTFKSVAECLKMNNMNETQLVEHLQRYLENQNYRNNYNAKKNAAYKIFKQDPEAAAKLEAIMKKLG